MLYYDLDAIPHGDDAPPLFTPPYVVLPVDGAVAIASCPMLGHVAVASLRHVLLLRLHLDSTQRTAMVTPLMRFTALVPIRNLALCLDTVAYASQNQVRCAVYAVSQVYKSDPPPAVADAFEFSAVHPRDSSPCVFPPPPQLHVVRFDLVSSGGLEYEEAAVPPAPGTSADLGDVEADEDELVCGFDEMGVPWRHLRSQVLELPSLEGGSLDQLAGDEITYGPLR